MKLLNFKNLDELTNKIKTEKQAINYFIKLRWGNKINPVCPFCNKKLEPIGTSGQFQCGTWGCDASFNFIATRDVWEYIDRTRKALDVAVDAIKNATEYLGNQEPLVDVMAMNLHTDLSKALEQITILKQKDVK